MVDDEKLVKTSKNKFDERAMQGPGACICPVMWWNGNPRSCPGAVYVIKLASRAWRLAMWMAAPGSTGGGN